MTAATTGWRWVAIRQNDTLQRIADRELADAGRWHELATLNRLLPPYLTGDPAIALASQGRVLLFGQQLRVFAPSVQAEADAQPADLYGRDLALSADGRLLAEARDFAQVSGLANLAAALTRRITTERGELIFHRGYGSMVRQVIGATSGPARLAFTAHAARQAIAADPRVERVTRARAEADGDTVTLTLEVQPIAAGQSMTLRTEV